ncbi:hypothetical protein B0P06_005696 [Clostridium saccharoperbutylacetonicum]|uniref:Uncharacterized protein n=1 Tax=Clostridium saccharoperbutylacetonicum N1-4(HMT) TaxID=931276 RepID=M1MX45_9CLOT|nr:hypothetical protein [Clostridium saccharoperbutylacetonicum]AGF56047.1 hypothetical protein Cspa_c22820 [Clostridium saccharoperbutylacetonicum N1-4(HMT)]NRT63214.1 hypothetical protein [Clostridium saccharoperbutylacetonicum]NSB26574.1 hypothetical protein [Clostridium saccharoperbutylacetonicum]NSB45925.1 hypothetical protein [Clostridium saccharoperbutylacetonicum]
MERMPYKRPTTHYDERIKQIDEKICELINKRKEKSENNPGYPPFEYISKWAEKFNLYEDLLKSFFGALWNEKLYIPLVKPEGFRMNLPVLKSLEIDEHLFSIMAIRQYSNSSVVNFNIDWDNTKDISEISPRHSNFEMVVSEEYECRMLDGCGGGGHFHYNFIVWPPLPDDLSGIELTFKEFTPPYRDKQIGNDIVIRL